MKTNRLTYPALFTMAYLIVWAVLHVARVDNPWVDRVIIGEIALCALFAVVAMSIATRRWTVRGLGIWGLMTAIVLIFATSQLVEWQVLDATPTIVRNLWRAVLAIAGPCMLYGYWSWLREGDEHES